MAAIIGSQPDNFLNFRLELIQQLSERGFTPDRAQLAAADALDVVRQALAGKPAGGLFGRLFGRAKPVSARGIYLWGGVGRGKTLIMDAFYNTLPDGKKHRSHFHRFMRMIHDDLKSLGEVSDPLDSVADRLAGDYRIICFDEFFVSDIADAMILGRLLEGLFQRGVTLVATSNVEPQNLYKDGLQRARFLPAIKLLEKHCEIMNVDGGIDYRLRTLEMAEMYLDANRPDSQQRMQQFFCEIAPGDIVEAREIVIEGRTLTTERCAKGVAWFDFATLCDGPRSQVDYIELSRLFQTVVVSDVPILTQTMEDQARRFIALVDEFYDRRVKLIVSASAPLENLYQGKRLNFEFERTRSRLIEMRSSDYLSQAHLA